MLGALISGAVWGVVVSIVLGGIYTVAAIKEKREA